MNLQTVFLHIINHILISVRGVCCLSHHGKNLLMILDVGEHADKVSLHVFFIICFYLIVQICIIQKRQVWICFSVPAHAHSGWQWTKANVWFLAVSIFVFCMNRTPEGSPFQFFLIRKLLKPLDKIIIIHDIINGNIGEVPVVIIVSCNFLFGILNTFLFPSLCVHFCFFAVFVNFPRCPCILVSRKVKLHDRTTQYIIIVESKFSPHQMSADRSKFSRPAGSLRNDDVVFPITSRYCIDLITMISRQKQFGINRQIQIHSGRDHFLVFSCNFVWIIIKF